MTVPELPAAIDTADRDAAERVARWAGRARGELARLGLEARRAEVDARRHEAALTEAVEGPPRAALVAVDETLDSAWKDGCARLGRARDEVALVLGAAAQQLSSPATPALPQISEPRPPRTAEELWAATPDRVAVASPAVADPAASSPAPRPSDDDAFWQDLPETDSVFARLRRLERRPR